MRKCFWAILSIFVILAMTTTAMAEVDFASMSDDEIADLIRSAAAELNSRHLEETRFILRDSDGILIYATGNLSIENSWSTLVLKLEVVIDNSTDEELTQNLRYQTVNGWDADNSNFYSCAPHSKKIAQINFKISDNPEVDSLDDVSVLTMKLYGGVGVTLVVQDGKIVSCTENDY